jgi:hypothetical protein
MGFWENQNKRPILKSRKSTPRLRDVTPDALALKNPDFCPN